jgi:O-antigen/teichoic acid export membrane protein
MNLRRAILQTLGSRQCSLLVMAVGTVVLARLLTPADFGVFAAAIAFMAVAGTIIDFGLPEFLIQRSSLDRATVAAATGLTLALGLAVAAVYGAAVLWLPDAVWVPDLRPVLALLLLALLAKPVIMPIETSLRREGSFGLVSILALVKISTQTAVAIALASAGFGAVALAGGILAETGVAAAVLVVAAGRGRWSLPTLHGWQPFFAFGLRYTAISLLSRIGEALIVVCFSRWLGFAALGQLDRARLVVRLFDRSVLDGIEPVVLPALSHLLREGSDPARLYLRKTRFLAALCWPVFAVIALLAEPLVAVVLGPQWTATEPAVRILCLMGLFLPFTRMSMKLFVALDMSREYLRLQTVHQAVRVLLAAGGALISFEAACLGIALSYGVKALLVTPALKAATGYRSGHLAGQSLRCLGIALCAVAGPALLLALAPALSDLASLAAGIALAGLGWLLGAAALRDPLLEELLVAARLRAPASDSGS